ncbi:heat shock protein Hsp18 [Clostridium brassicae]|uniref:Hsp20/alpha crystallin family protein n=1 Tax=Clostridium brassicae TaxID=2999072 RepID=A0ABT4D7C6_9CLOT|nr:heat shock protein Hsp18 [Clostridium brassicae]MCY6958184.1 Hsp20/alpha crystallin family protein [Clostridium brassicae]
MFEMVPFRRNNGLRKRTDNYVDRLFDDLFNDSIFPSALANNEFNVDVKETETSYIVDADLPGVKKEAIEIDYENNYLSIRAKRDDIVEEKQDNYVRRERRYGQFSRSFYIDNVEEDKIEATFNDGVLKLTLPKKEKGKPNKRKIDIH